MSSYVSRVRGLYMDGWLNESSAGADEKGALAKLIQAHGVAQGLGFIVAMAVCAVTGVVGNSVVLAVLKERLKESSQLAFRSHYNHFTCALAASDLFVCCVSIPYEAFVALRLIVADVPCKAMGLLSYVAIIFAAVTHFGICIERYYAVCRPISPISTRQMRIVVGFVALVSAALAVPSLFTFSVYSLASDEEPVGCHYRYDSEVGLYYNIVLGVILSSSIVTMLTVYGIIFRAIAKRTLTKKKAQAADAVELNAKSSNTSGGSVDAKDGMQLKASNSSFFKRRISSTSRVAFMFFAVTAVFYASWIPYFLCALDVIPRNIILENSHFINSCSNFILYSVFQGDLRREMLRKLTCRRTQQK